MKPVFQAAAVALGIAGVVIGIHAAEVSHDSHTVAQAATPAPTAPPSYPNISVQAEQQKYSSWCLVAAQQMDLTTYNVADTQDALAAEDGTTAAGTSLQTAAEVFTQETDVPAYWSEATPYDLVYNATAELDQGHGLIIATDAALLPWAHSDHSEHAILVTAVDGSNLRVIDPWTASTHWLSANQLASASTYDLIGD